METVQWINRQSDIKSERFIVKSILTCSQKLLHAFVNIKISTVTPKSLRNQQNQSKHVKRTELFFLKTRQRRKTNKEKKSGGGGGGLGGGDFAST